MRTLGAWSPVRCACCCGGAACPGGWAEPWADVGPVTDPPWGALGGSPLIVTAPGTAVVAPGGSVMLRQIGADVGRVSGSLFVTDTTDPLGPAVSVAAYDFCGGQAIGVQWNPTGLTWEVASLSGSTPVAAVGADQPFVMQWNATDWSVTIGGEPAVTGAWGAPLVGDFYVLLQAQGPAGGETGYGPMVADCSVLP